MASATLSGVWVAAITELLSSGSIFTRGAVAAAWAIASVAAWCFAVSAAKSGQLSSASGSLGFETDSAAAESLALADWLLLTGLSVILLLLAIVAFVAPPNTWDAMQYTMPRIIMWIENHGVHFYPTVDYAQLMMSPWADYAMAHLTLLAGSDRLVNLVTWFAFTGSIIGVSLIARELGCGRRGQVLAAVFCGTIPQGILAATSAKPDVAVGFWIVASCFFLLRWKSAPTWTNVMLAGAGIGLSILSKGTAFTLLPAVCLAIFFIWSAANRKTFLVRLPAVVVIILALNGAQFYRNIRLSGSPLGFSSPDGDADKKGARHFANGKFGPRDIAGNVLRSAALHLGTPNGTINSWTADRFRQVMRGIGVDPDDQAMIEQGNAGKIHEFEIPVLAQSEVFAGNMLHALLFLFSAAILVLLRRPGQRDTALLAAGVIGAFVLFCAAVRWQPYNARFHLPVFMLGCAVIGAALAPRLPRWMLLVAAGLAIVSAMPYAISNEMRPFVWHSIFSRLTSRSHAKHIYDLARSSLFSGPASLRGRFILRRSAHGGRFGLQRCRARRFRFALRLSDAGPVTRGIGRAGGALRRRAEPFRGLPARLGSGALRGGLSWLRSGWREMEGIRRTWNYCVPIRSNCCLLAGARRRGATSRYFKNRGRETGGRRVSDFELVQRR